MKKFVTILLLIGLLVLMLVGCNASATPAPAAQSKLEDTTAPTLPLRTATQPPPTATPAPPTATLPPPPTATLPPEVLAGKPEDISGVWLVKLLEHAGTAHFEFTKEGAYSLKGVSGDAKGATIDSGKFRFEGTQLQLESTGGCLDAQGKEIPNCIGVYQAYVIKQGDKPIQLKLVAVKDPAGDRKNTYNNQNLPWVEP